jgi:hypothetical protein
MRPCIEAVSGVAPTFVLMLASWRGWVWYFGFISWVLRDSDSLSDEKSDKNLGQSKEKEGSSEKSSLAGIWES